MGKDDESCVTSSFDEGNPVNKTNHGKEEDGAKRLPFYVPRNPTFFQHDLRLLDGEEDKMIDKEENLFRNKKTINIETDSWKHDKFVEEEQKPKSKQELFDTYGYDIHVDDPKTFYKKSSGRDKSRNIQNYRDKKNEYGLNKKNQSNLKSTDRRYEDDNMARSEVKDKNEKIVPKEKDETSLDLRNHFKDKYNEIYSNFKDLNISENKLHHKKESLKNYKSKEISLGLSSYSKSFTNQAQENSNKKIVIIDLDKKIAGNDLNSKKIYRKDANKEIILKDKVRRDDYYQSLKAMEPVNVVAKLKHLKELDDEVEKEDASNQSQTHLDYFSAQNRNNFIFPAPPDVTINHLTPMMTQNPYYLQHYQQQNIELSMSCGYYGPVQPNYFHGSNIAVLEQQCSWSSPIGSQMTGQVINSVPSYCIVQDNVNIIKKEERNVKFTPTSETAVATSTPIRTVHRYSVMRSQIKKHFTT